MTQEQKNLVYICRFFIEERNSTKELRQYLKDFEVHKNSHPFDGWLGAKDSSHCFVWGYNSIVDCKNAHKWDAMDEQYRVWYANLPENQPEPETKTNGDKFREAIQNALFKKLPPEFTEWLKSVEKVNPEHAAFFRENFSWEEWESYSEVFDHVGVRAIPNQARIEIGFEKIYDLTETYPYPIPKPEPIDPLDGLKEGDIVVSPNGRWERKVLGVCGSVFLMSSEGPLDEYAAGYTLAELKTEKFTKL